MRRMDRKSKAKFTRTAATSGSSARFIQPMLLLQTDSLPDSQQWLYELKLDGYRALAFKRDGVVHLRSRNDNDFSVRYPDVVKGLAKMPDNTVIDGEVIAFDDDGRPSFNALQNYGSAPAPVLYYVFDVMVLNGRDVMCEPLERRRELLEKRVLPKLTEPVSYASPLDASCSGARGVGEGPWLRRTRGEAPKQRVRAGTPHWCVGEDACQPWSGIRDRRLHARNQDVRCAGVWVLRRRQADLRCKNAQRVYAGHACAVVPEVQGTRDQRVPVCESPGGAERSRGP